MIQVIFMLRVCLKHYFSCTLMFNVQLQNDAWVVGRHMLHGTDSFANLCPWRT